ncbi:MULTISPECIES: DUF4097 family beta strand repeat-containing protein [Streptomyces]|uniref:Adhesin domain-containing protein n=1 Tax=Streptomyces tsukubensis (strain DSM 42081 / NBRC 108919 / NRRL 18488 / 9993) TaxID=1114943 RepID=I2N609_STRT9|nr:MULTISPECIES: hypothetical protein [Streptomyces]AZK96450.1 hypothetical protein B7R87_23170 [Streptomyces tsukubensis]EIF92456.1 hypothetical protein [Streptomyces tsukubensis NRRL18488]MYS66883.1 hypothetical protein [Streptomyces sp. SID5473]QKM67548.1 hypothetical protein STSU_010625 [Streptomyces tsukubensis NRRL18488]TAI43944.1 hypothetical protein EWI31_10430 [Streptomyces tsukubensis]
MAESTWEVPEPRRLGFDTPVTALDVRIVNGTVNVVGTDEPSARLEVSSIDGPPLVVTHTDGRLTVAYPDLPRQGRLKWLDHKKWHRDAVVSLAVPVEATVDVTVVGANTVVSGIAGATSVRGVSGDTTLVRLSGPIRTDTVSGALEAQSVTGGLRFSSVSGDLTVIEGAGSSVRAESVSGSMTVDLAPRDDDRPAGGSYGPTELRLATLSGAVAIRLPDRTDARVKAETASGSVSNAFDDLKVGGDWGARTITGTLGTGTGTLRASTLSGSLALLRTPPRDDAHVAAGPAGPAQEEVL